MPVKVNLRHLEAHPIRLDGQVPVSELDIDTQDEMIQLTKTLDYDLEVEKVEHSLLVQGTLKLQLHCQCVRCLQPFDYNLELKHWVAHLPLEGEDAVPVVNDCVDLTAYIREDILLEFPQHPLCNQECRGLPELQGSSDSDQSSD